MSFPFGGATILCLLLGAMRSADSGSGSLSIYALAGLVGGLIGLGAGLGSLRSGRDRRRIVRLNRIQAALRRITLLVAEANHSGELVQPVCSYLRQYFGYHHVWLALKSFTTACSVCSISSLYSPLSLMRSSRAWCFVVMKLCSADSKSTTFLVSMSSR